MRKVKKDRRGLVVLSETFHAIGISRGLFSYDVLVDKKICVKKHQLGKWFPERDPHLQTIIEGMQASFLNSAGEPLVSQILVGGPDYMKEMLKKKLKRVPKLAALLGEFFVVGKPTKASIALRLNDILVILENRLAKRTSVLRD